MFNFIVIVIAGIYSPDCIGFGVRGAQAQADRRVGKLAIHSPSW